MSRIITELPTQHVFVFGSNLGGRHGKGAALTAVKHFGAKYGRAEGRQGRSYAIPTKNYRLESLPLGEIERHVQKFLCHAVLSSEKFVVTEIGCGLAGYKAKQIAPMFFGSGENVLLPRSFADYMRPAAPRLQTWEDYL